jgi:hypothetical protein
VSLLVPGDANHAQSHRWLAAYLARSDRQIAAPNLLLLVIAGALARRSGNGRVALRPIRRLRRNRHLLLVELDAAVARRATQLAALGASEAPTPCMWRSPGSWVFHQALMRLFRSPSQRLVRL